MSEGLYEELKAYEGLPAAEGGVGRDLVNEPMIRHWCEAMGDTNPAYTGPDAIAPPTMLQAWTMGGLGGHRSRSAAQDELFGLLDKAGFSSVVATDCEQEYLRPIRVGDEITFDAVIESVSEQKTTKLGTGHFVTTRMDVRANGELAGTHRFRILKFAPAKRPSTAGSASGPASGSASGPASGSASGSSKPAAEDGKPARRPRPVINRDNAGFWKGVEEHKVLIQRCTECSVLRFPWLPGCNSCGGAEWDTVEASGEGTVFSYVVMHHPPFPAFDPPYAVGLIELAEGVRMISNVVGVPHDEVRIGMAVRLEFLRTDEELEVPVFRPVGASAAVGSVA
ncbi:bifunctional MaoC family dehydratase N-terminal/OB-fold nucleic acid binding domain-containing protein [Streptomyces sp. N35]|uniref:bifunctional MaoC family dehydratase N-terminal/OB-fold nucleic acid binding domain-containing protein n=1 Tax=Streptomyces sp. N35 TaxID=2795730 RepID=UPI0018F724E3|nr:bifunctional MaoC family dehydratase N-terminal/OB-fold nucleic acid binding domain-containing protein [Streptomyces sp. N35]